MIVIKACLGVGDYMITSSMLNKAEENGISYHTLYRRLQRGWDEERAVTEPSKKKSERQYWLEIAKENGIIEGTFNSRVNLYGYSYEEAATKPIKNKRKKVKP